jgi:hypothetical protein
VQKTQYRNYIIGATWWTTWFVTQVLLLVFTAGMTWRLAAIDSFFTNTVLALTAYAMITMLRFYQPRPLYRLCFTLGLSVTALLLLHWMMTQVLTNETDYQYFLESSLPVRGLFMWLIIALVAVLSWFWSYFRERQEDEGRKAAAEKLAREAELWQLRQQLQPHFLFNSLNSISALILVKPEEARTMVQQLSDFLRGTIRKDDQQLITLNEELAHLNLYLDIEKVRFGHRLNTQVTHDEASLAMTLPPLLLQPVVENAIKFGLYDTIGEVTIAIEAKAVGNQLHVTVQNPFDPATAQPRQGTGFGLTSVQRRLYLLYARQDLVSTRQDENIFTTQIQIPQAS